jgi:hypothetical protein
MDEPRKLHGSRAKLAERYRANIVRAFSLCSDFSGRWRQEIGMHILVRDKRTGAEDWIRLEKAAELMGMPADEIEGLLAEYGECESADYIAIEPEYS